MAAVLAGVRSASFAAAHVITPNPAIEHAHELLCARAVVRMVCSQGACVSELRIKNLATVLQLQCTIRGADERLSAMLPLTTKVERPQCRGKGSTTPPQASVHVYVAYYLVCLNFRTYMNRNLLLASSSFAKPNMSGNATKRTAAMISPMPLRRNR